MTNKPNTKMSFENIMTYLRFNHIKKCDKEDDFYPTFMQMFQWLVLFICLAMLLYLIYIFILMPIVFKNKE